MSGVAAWMQCEDILNKVREELILEAIDVLHREAEAKRIAIEGNVVTTPDRSGELERDIYIINNLLDREQEMRDKYAAFIREKEAKPAELDAHTVQRIEELKKFLVALTEISVLMHYSHQMNEWIEDVRKLYKISDPARLLATVVAHNDQRVDTLRFVLKNKTFVKEEVLSGEERGILERAEAEASKGR